MNQSAQVAVGGAMPAEAHFAPANVGAPAVFDVQLEPGERLVRYELYNYTTEKVILIVLGVLTSWMLIGLWFLYQAFTNESKGAKGIAVTTQRVIVGANAKFNGGQHLVLPLGQISDIEPVRRNVSTGGGGLIGAAISAGATAVANSMANKADKTTKKYWARAEDITLISHDGTRVNLGSRNATEDGIFIATGMAHGGFDSCPDVAAA